MLGDVGEVGKVRDGRERDREREEDFSQIPVWPRLMGMVPGRPSFASCPSHPAHLHLACLKCCKPCTRDNDWPPKPGLLQEPVNDVRCLAFFSKAAAQGKRKFIDFNDTIKLLKIVSLQLFLFFKDKKKKGMSRTWLLFADHMLIFLSFF